MWVGGLFGRQKLVRKNTLNEPPVASIYGIQAYTSQGELMNFERFKGKKLLIVNTASDCGYTAQYSELEELYKTHKDILEILAFPANDFKQQERGTDGEIERF
ncbi:MAG: glutathione peroxidase, partial [Bacteroidetes bacterium]